MKFEELIVGDFFTLKDEIDFEGVIVKNVDFIYFKSCDNIYLLNEHWGAIPMKLQAFENKEVNYLTEINLPNSEKKFFIVNNNHIYSELCDNSDSCVSLNIEGGYYEKAEKLSKDDSPYHIKIII